MTNWADYQVGRRVVCINNDLLIPTGVVFLQVPPLPQVGRVYTISTVLPGKLTGELCLSLQEIGEIWVDLLLLGQLARGLVMYEAKKFRPIDESKIDQFRKMLTPAPTVGEPA